MTTPINSWVGTSHDLRWPHARLNVASTIGAHSSFKENGQLQKLNTPCWVMDTFRSSRSIGIAADIPIGTPWRVYKRSKRQMLDQSLLKDAFGFSASVFFLDIFAFFVSAWPFGSIAFFFDPREFFRTFFAVPVVLPFVAAARGAVELLRLRGIKSCASLNT